jgi:hypothetical protein
VTKWPQNGKKQHEDYHNPNLKLVIKVWIPVAFLMRLAMKMTLEKKISIFSNMGHQLAMLF